MKAIILSIIILPLAFTAKANFTVEHTNKKIYQEFTSLQAALDTLAIYANHEFEYVITLSDTVHENIVWPMNSPRITINGNGNHIVGNGKGSVIQIDFVANPITLSNLTIEGGNAIHGGGIYMNEGDLTLEEVSITNNTATVKGGGLYANLGRLMLLGADLTDNISGVEGSHISVSDTKIDGHEITVPCDGAHDRQSLVATGEATKIYHLIQNNATVTVESKVSTGQSI